ncbi:hypothetical protein C7455_102241 [Roseicyclus mahoneyensis]|jgi:hypothetical protein|uniref:Uncharacterized protein n=1 Tax=Roseicyclus mahoneyensis TaxID=164332 RepID=A0A316GL56_9RHOB|nr:hypothetical protein C7455_102241 [Roseicyclus mahoneyensis]
MSFLQFFLGKLENSEKKGSVPHLETDIMSIYFDSRHGMGDTLPNHLLPDRRETTE